MPRIRCHYLDCLFLDERYCSAAAIELNQEGGCLTFQPTDDPEPGSNWQEGIDDWNELGEDEDEDEDSATLWEDEEDDEDDSDIDEDEEY